MSRHVTLLLQDPAGRPLGALPPFDVVDPWWPDALPVVQEAAGRFGAEIRVLRFLDGTPAGEAGTRDGTVRYLAELRSGPTGLPLRPAGAYDARDHPLRLPWARPGGIDRILGWADNALAGLGRPRTGPAVQVRVWNLSHIMRLPTGAGTAWCKSVPPFFAHEAAALALVPTFGPKPGLPRLLAADPATRSLLVDDVPGEDRYAAAPSELPAMVDALVDLQLRSAERLDALLAAGLPDWRADPLTAALRRLVGREDVARTVARDELVAVRRLVDALPSRWAELAACGLPDTLVHGDFHAGNWRGTPQSAVLLDWGDCGIGHPLLDVAAFAGDDPAREALFVTAWGSRIPAADVRRAARLVAPVAALRQALVYRTFLDALEPAEHVFHAADVPHWLRTAARLAERAEAER